jgi:putative ABC transport system permease protein
MNHLFTDARFTLRLMRRAPGFYATLLAVLIAGIGATTAMFSLAESLLLKPLPYPDADRLMMVWRTNPRIPAGPASVPDFLDWKAQATKVESMSATDYATVSLSSPGAKPESLPGARVSGEFFSMLGVRPLLGRLLTTEDDRPGAPGVVVISAELWRRRFSADPQIVGRAIMLDGEAFTVAGVAEEGFCFSGPKSDHADFWLALAASPHWEHWSTHRGDHFLHIMGKRRVGVSLAEVQAQLTSIAKGIEAAHPDSNTKEGNRAADLHDELVATSASSVWVLFAAVALVFVIVCANVANLLLTRAQGRRAEMAARAALGATSSRLAMQVVTETAVVFLIAALGGAVAARWLVDLFASGIVGGAARTLPMRVDGTALVLCVTVSLLFGMIFGLVPALATSRVEPQAVLKDSASRAGVARPQRLARNALVVAQVAIACALLTGSGLALDAFAKASSKSPGFDAADLATARISLPESKYDDPKALAFFQQLIERIAREPGVSSVAANGMLPLAGSNWNSSFDIEGRPAWPRGEEPSLERNVVTAGYFKTMGIPLLHGRDFNDGDRADGRKVTIISQSVAERFFPGEDPIGHRINFGDGWMEIVGISGSVLRRGLDQPVAIEAYVPIAQGGENSMVVAVRTPRAAALLQDLPRIVEALDPTQAVSNRKLMAERVSDSIGNQRYVTVLLGAFAIAALLLATLGVFGLVSYSTSQRARELGIRMVLGSTPEAVVALVLKGGARLVGLGLIIGLALAFIVGRVLASRVAGVASFDIAIYAAVPAILTVTGLVACLFPALRVVRIPPAIALRYE